MTNETARTERRGESLVSRISTDLRRDIEAGKFAPGSRLPSENELTREYSVSRAVVREAIAILRAGGLVEARKGAGVFALEVNAKAQPFHNLDPDRVSSVIELLEIRTVFEVESAALAASIGNPDRGNTRGTQPCPRVPAAGCPDTRRGLRPASGDCRRHAEPPLRRVSPTDPHRHHSPWGIAGSSAWRPPKGLQSQFAGRTRADRRCHHRRRRRIRP